MTEAAFGNSKEIITNQEGIHEKLTEVVEKHLATPSKKPFQQHTLDAFEQVKERLKGHQGDIILDPFMGSGTIPMMAKHNNRKYIGIDNNKEYANSVEMREGTCNNNVDKSVNKRMADYAKENVSTHVEVTWTDMYI